MLTEQITQLDEQQRQRFNDYIQWWSQSWLITGSNDQHEVSAALGRIYQRLGRKEPFVIWCDSPWQTAVMPFLLRLVCFTPTERQRRLLRRSYDRDLKETIRFELARNLNDELWSRALEVLMSQLEPEIELALAHETPDSARPIVSIERALELAIDNIMYDAHCDLRRSLSLNIIEEAIRELAAVSRPAMRARLTMEARLGTEIGRRFSDFNASIRGGFLAPSCPLIRQFIQQMGTEFSVHMGRLLTEDWMYLNDVTHSRWSEMRPEARLAQAMTDYALTWATWSQDFFRVYLFPLRVFGDEFYRDKVSAQLKDYATIRLGAFMYVFGERVVFACKNPLAVRLDDQQALHSYTAPSVEFLDGYSLYSWQGVPVLKDLIHRPELLTIAWIEGERNTEVRRVLVDKYGPAKYLQDSGAKLIAQDEFGSLFSKEMPGDEPLVMVRVTNSSPEPDGTYKDYFLRVPPNVRTPKEAIAWTFDVDPQNYRPEIET